MIAATRRWLWAVLAALPLPAAAVHVSAEGQGQVLIYPYYTVQEADGNAFNTYVSIVNDRPEAKALRVRFREGRNGREVAGFNLLLGPRDTWTAAIAPTPVGARLLSVDASCVAPALGTDLQTPYLDFTAANYTGANADEFGEETTRVREGYVEVFEMAAFDTVPACADFRASTLAPATPRVPTGRLSGTLTLINVESGLDFTLNAVALDDVAAQPYFRPPADAYPDYTAAEIKPSAGFFLGDQFYRTVWQTPLDAVNAALLSFQLANEVVMDSGTRSGTDFVVTLPTKRLANATPPYSNLQGATSRDIAFAVDFSSREGAAIHVAQECDFMCPPGLDAADTRLRWVSSVVSLRPVAGRSSAAPATSDVFGSRNGWLLNLGTTAQNGFLSMYLEGAEMEAQFPLLHSRIDLESGLATDVRPRYAGLPAVGFMARTFRNGNLACAGAVCQGNYGGAFPHLRTRHASQ